MPRNRSNDKRHVEQYEHKGKKRANNPPVGLVDSRADAGEGKRTYAYDPHLDPSLIWAGKAERTSFELPTVSLHVHERIDPRAIIEAVRQKTGETTSSFPSSAPKRKTRHFGKRLSFTSTHTTGATALSLGIVCW
jgi:hypothetical protein